MDVEIRFSSISRRWFFKVLLPMVVFIVVVSTAICLFVRSYYIERVRDTAQEYANSFSLLATNDKDIFASSAREYCEQFEHKHEVEIMVLDSDGKIIVSTSGFQRVITKMPDYYEAVKTGDSAYWIGTSSAGEPIMAGTYLLRDYGDGSNGAIRYAVSLTACYKRIAFYVIMVVLLSLGALLFSTLSGLFFIKSIAIPVRAVSAAARKIASGDYKEELPTNRTDEIGELCDSINYMETELKNAEKLKNDFISSVSHELRTPLTAIRGWAETAKMSVGTDTDLVNRGLDVVLSETNRLSSLVEELLDFSRIQAGRFSFNMQPLSVTSVLSEAVDMYVELAAKQNIEVSFAVPSEDSFVNGDPNRLKQVFVNIIDNAVKYTGEQGQVLVQQILEEGCVRVVVKDTGVGIPAADIDHVKEKFYKANKEVRGSGIGLAVADEIIKQHQGLLFIESTEGVGTTVTIVLPLCAMPEEPVLQNEEINDNTTQQSEADE